MVVKQFWCIAWSLLSCVTEHHSISIKPFITRFRFCFAAFSDECTKGKRFVIFVCINIILLALYNNSIWVPLFMVWQMVVCIKLSLVCTVVFLLSSKFNLIIISISCLNVVFLQGLQNISTALDSINTMHGQLERLIAETSARQVSSASVLFIELSFAVSMGSWL